MFLGWQNNTRIDFINFAYIQLSKTSIKSLLHNHSLPVSIAWLHLLTFQPCWGLQPIPCHAPGQPQLNAFSHHVDLHCPIFSPSQQKLCDRTPKQYPLICQLVALHLRPTCIKVWIWGTFLWSVQWDAQYCECERILTARSPSLDQQPSSDTRNRWEV